MPIRWLKTFSILCFVVLTSALGVILFNADQTAAQIPTPTPTPTPYPTPAPISYTASVSATMPDIVPPSVPILISPENTELISTDQPQFVWQESTDNVAMSHYQLTIDGELALDNIALYTNSGSYKLYNLSYNSSLGYYYLDLNYSLDQGSHTWKITAVDAVGLTTDSATWSFTVDSIAPSFVITQIDEKEVSISAQDVKTVPSEAITLTHNEPQIRGTGEAHSQVEMQIRISDENVQIVEFEIDGHGNWSYTLPILPRGQVITLNFTITDQAGHISILENVQLILPALEIVIPAESVTPTPAPGEPSARVPPEPEPTKQPIKIPYLPPKEIAHLVLQQLPTPILRVTQTPWFKTWLRLVGPWLVVLLIFWPHVLETVLVGQQFGPSLSWAVIKKIWQATGIVPYLNRQGWAFDVRLETATQQQPEKNLAFNHGLPFAELTVISQPADDKLPPLVKIGLTDAQGLYLPFELPPSHYRLSLTHQDYRYPSLVERPAQTPILDFYQAQPLPLTPNNQSFSLQIPADPDINYELSAIDKKPLQRFSSLTKLKLQLAKIIQYESWWNVAALVMSSLILLFYPSAFNWLAYAFYLSLGIFYKQKEALCANVSGLVIDTNGEPLANALVRLSDLNDAHRTLAAVSDQDGKFYFYLMKGRFKPSVAKLGYLEGQKPEVDKVIEVEQCLEQKNLVLIMAKKV
jgi:hypothetical protein